MSRAKCTCTFGVSKACPRHGRKKQSGRTSTARTYTLDDGEIRSVSATTPETAEVMERIITHNRNAAYSLAATRMRDRCVAKVGVMADEWLKRSIEDKDAERSRNLRLSYNVAQNIITELESVALDGQERSVQGAGIQRCLRQVKMMLVNWQDGMRWPHRGDLLDEVISRLESLTLEHCSGLHVDKP